ncbi:MAG: DUF89 family protein [Fibrobacteria bacterium]|nr:DUF89 family protein [Fibrobacteria bacterium]
MKTLVDCFPCYINQALDGSRTVTSDESIQKKVLDETVKMLQNLDYNRVPAETGAEVFRIIQRVTGNSDPYLEVKNRFNNFALELETALRKRIKDSEDPFITAALFAITGNIIDFGIGGGINEERVLAELQNIARETDVISNLEQLKQSTIKAKQILYIGDNAGEIVFDKLFVERLTPAKVTFAVRSEPIINDITMKDAHDVGLTSLVEVIPSGSCIPGTLVQNCTTEFQDLFYQADVIISKGQGNYETLHHEKRPVFFLLKVKCPTVVKTLGKKLGDVMCIVPEI